MKLEYQFSGRRFFDVCEASALRTALEWFGECRRVVSGEGVSPSLSPRRLRAKYTLRTNLRFMLRGFRPCRGQIRAPKGGTHGRRCFQWLHFWGNVKPRLRDFAEVPLRLLKRDSRELSGYGHGFATNRPMAAAHKKSGGIGLSARGKEKGICEKKFIYRNGEAA